jgi:hypothetical protein
MPSQLASEFPRLFIRPTRDYLLRMPKDISIVAACSEVGCENWLYGWDTILDEGTPEGRDGANWIRSGQSRRDFTEMRGGDVTVFRFGPHQRCFGEHRTRPQRFLVRAGQQLSARSGLRDWIDDLGEHAGQLEDQLKRG